MVKIFNCYLYAKKSYDTLSKGAIFLGQPCKMKRDKIRLYYQMRKNMRQTDERLKIKIKGFCANPVNDTYP